MRRSGRVIATTTAAALAGLATLALPSAPATARPGDDGSPGSVAGAIGDVTPVDPEITQGKNLPLDRRSLAAAKRSMSARSSAAAAGDSTVGDTKTWLALDFVSGEIYVKTYTLRGLGEHIAVWVAEDRDFPDGDCRNTLDLTAITDEQVDSFVDEFDTNIYPTESASFSVAPDRDGTDAPLAGAIGEPADYYQVPADEADDTVVLVDNVRDENFYTPTEPDGQTYTAGFFYSVFNDYVNRNVMTIDAFDWLHRTGATPSDDSADPAYEACSAEVGAVGNRALGLPRPRLYEGTFAHEYQHLLESYADPDEVNWVNEGLSDYAQTLVGYVDPALTPTDPSADSHIASFLGFNGEAFGGPENSLTLWEDQGPPEILADYGAAYTMMEYLSGKYGPQFLTDLHRAAGNGFEGLDDVLSDHDALRNSQQTLHDWSAAVALDGPLGNHARRNPLRRFSVKTLRSWVNWGSPQAYDTPGAPPNGSDYVRLRNGKGRYLSGRALRKLVFRGAQGLEPAPVEWTSDATPPAATTADTACGSVPDGPAEQALYSGCGGNLDRSIARTVSVPTGSGATLTFDALWDTEAGWDFGFVQVSTDGGRTWTSLATTDTTAAHDPGAIASVVDNLPGFTDDSGTWRTQTADLSDYAGQDVLLGFRHISDPSVNEAGFWVRDISVGSTTVPTSLAGWQTYTQISPVPVSGYTVQLVGLRRHRPVHYRALRLDSSFHGVLRGRALRHALGRGSRLTGAIVTYDDPTETQTQYARYRLVVNGHLQPGG